eukprot:1148008-Pelagomonas_calceolata.AAC.4
MKQIVVLNPWVNCLQAGPIVDHHPKPAGAEQAALHHSPLLRFVTTITLPDAQAFDKHDVTTYTLRNAPLIGLAGLVAGLQEAFYQFEVSASCCAGHDASRGDRS